jgi:hypothetical protein
MSDLFSNLVKEIETVSEPMGTNSNINDYKSSLRTKKISDKAIESIRAKGHFVEIDRDTMTIYYSKNKKYDNV